MAIGLQKNLKIGSRVALREQWKKVRDPGVSFELTDIEEFRVIDNEGFSQFAIIPASVTCLASSIEPGMVHWVKREELLLPENPDTFFG